MTTQNIAVGVLADTTDEVNETVTVTLSNPSEVTLMMQQAFSPSQMMIQLLLFQQQTSQYQTKQVFLIL